MTSLPISRMTLYKHGVGFFERRAEVTGEEVNLSFPTAEMNDILKSLTVIDRGKGKVLGVEYPTPKERAQRLASCTVQLEDSRSMRDLLISLRGRSVCLLLEGNKTLKGMLLGLDEANDDQPMDSNLVSILVENTDRADKVLFSQLQGLEILDSEAIGDLRYFLKVEASQDKTCSVKVRLSPGSHDLSISYIASAPTWRVSYRLVTERQGVDNDAKALLLGWGIFDNILDEDLNAISLALIAGMPISFIYNLYNPFTPDRPVIEEEKRTIPGAVTLGAVADELQPVPEMAAGLSNARRMKMNAPSPAKIGFIKESVSSDATGQAFGELFKYAIQTPVTVNRGGSALVPIISADVCVRRDLIFNPNQLPIHPIATFRFKNSTGLTLERGPVTVIENGEYSGEAILPYTSGGSEAVVPFAVELGIKVTQNSENRREWYRLAIKDAYLVFEDWDIYTFDYQLNNSTERAMDVLIDHPRHYGYEMFETPDPKEKTDETFRFEVKIQAQAEKKLKVNERKLIMRREEINKQKYENLRKYLHQGLLNQGQYDRLAELLVLYDKLTNTQKQSGQISEKREAIYKEQGQIRNNMKALGDDKTEQAMRASYVEKLQASENRLEALAKEEVDLQAENKRLEQEIEKLVEQMGK